jgi:hypothetical protein
MSRARLDRLEKKLAGDRCPECVDWERLTLVEKLMIVKVGDPPPPPIPEPPPPPDHCHRCGRDLSSQERIVEAIIVDLSEVQL